MALPPGMPAHLSHRQAALRYYNVGVRPPPPSTEQEQGQHDIKLMERVVLAKFEQNPRLWEVLMQPARPRLLSIPCAIPFLLMVAMAAVRITWERCS